MRKPIQLKSLLSENTDKDLKELESLLKGHDWWYQRSDDHRYWKQGSEQSKEINYKIQDLTRDGVDKKVINKLWNKYAPKEMQKK